jgi:hypothetical protein
MYFNEETFPVRKTNVTAAAALLAAVTFASSAYAAVIPVVSADPGTGQNFSSQPLGPAVGSFAIGDWTFTPVANSQILIGSDGNGAQPFGTSGNYLSVLGGGSIDISFSSRTSISFFWGSVDSYNSIVFHNAAGDIITGSNVAPLLPTGCQNSAACNGYVTFNSDTAFSSVTLSSSGNSFEITNISAVPEPSTWAMMILGFLGLGFFGYRKSKHSGPAFRIA